MEMSYREQLQAELKRRQMGNPHYSLRAFAKALGVSPAFLSKVFNGKKDISAKTALALAKKLGFNPEETSQFCQLVQLSKTESPELKRALAPGLQHEDSALEYHSLELEAFQVISDWHHYAILELSNCPKEKMTAETIAERLGISKERAITALNRLVRLGLLENQRGRWTKSKTFLAISSKTPSRSIRNFHIQMLEKAKESVDSVPMELRDLSGTTVAISKDKLDIARKEIKAFRRKMAKLLDSSRPTDVYQLNVQFFPLSKVNSDRTGP